MPLIAFQTGDITIAENAGRSSLVIYNESNRSANYSLSGVVSSISPILAPSEPLVIPVGYTGPVTLNFIGTALGAEGGLNVVESAIGPSYNGVSVNEIKTTAYRASTDEGGFEWGMMIRPDAGTYPFILGSEVRITKAFRSETAGFCSLVAVERVGEDDADVVYFGGDSWREGTTLNQDTFSSVHYCLSMSEGRFDAIRTTGRAINTDIINTSTQIADADGVSYTPQAGDLLFYYSNARISGDTASITANYIMVDE